MFGVGENEEVLKYFSRYSIIDVAIFTTTNLKAIVNTINILLHIQIILKFHAIKIINNLIKQKTF